MEISLIKNVILTYVMLFKVVIHFVSLSESCVFQGNF